MLSPGPAAVPVHARRVGPSGPNILIIVADDHAGGTLGVDGDPHRATPNLDRLAGQGVRFDRAYCNAPVCTPSRQSLITGRLPHAVGVTQLMTPLPKDAVTLGDWLGHLGYHTAAYGKMHFNDDRLHGFLERLDRPDYLAWYRAQFPGAPAPFRKFRPFRDPAREWLNAACEPVPISERATEAAYYAERAGGLFRRPGARPFLAVVGFNEPHSPFPFPREWAGRYRPEDFPAPSLSEYDRRTQPLVFADLTPKDFQGVQAAYYTSLSFLDAQVGRLLDALDASGRADDTIVVFVGDNGYLRGHHGRFEKHCFYEQAVRVPLIVRWPGHLPAGRRVEAMVEMVDVLPTLLELSGQPKPPDLHGRSLVPLLLGTPGAEGRDVVVSEYTENEEAMARSERFKLIAGTGRRKRQDGYHDGHPLPGPYERLYDLQADPGETTDLAERPEFAPVVASLRHRLYERLISTRGEVGPPPKGLTELQAIHWCVVPRDLPRH